MTFALIVFSVGWFLLCSSASIFHPRRENSKKSFVLSRLIDAWNDRSADRDNIIGAHVLFLMCVVFVILATSRDYHFILACMGVFVLVTHAYLLRIPNKLSHWVEISVVIFDTTVVGLELWAATLSGH